MLRLMERLGPVMQGLNRPYEIIFVDDGSKDHSLAILKKMAAEPGIKIIELTKNYGQHAAIFAGFFVSKGDIVITMDADLQNPPEEIPRLVKVMEEGGFDVVGTIRKQRKDSVFRTMPSKIVNMVARKITRVQMTDWGCMLRAYRRTIVNRMIDCHEQSTFIPALATYFAKKVTEIEVAHEQRFAGESHYPLRKLINLQFDLVSSFSDFPLKIIMSWGIAMALLGIGFGAVLGIARAVYGAQWAAEGVFTLFAILFAFIGFQFFALGVMGEYIGRIYREVGRRWRNMLLRRSIPLKPELPGRELEMKSVVFAYHDMGIVGLEALKRANFEIRALFTHHDNPGENCWFSSVAQWGLKNGIEVLIPADVNAPASVDRIRALSPEAIFSFYYRTLLSDEILKIPDAGAYNLHGSLLPAYRGRVPVNWAIINGEEKTGVTLHHMVSKADAGDIVGQREVAISREDTAYTLFRKLLRAADLLLEEVLPLIKSRQAPRTRQDLSRGSYYGARRPEDGKIEWGWSARTIYNLVRALTEPYPGAFAYLPSGEKILVWWAEPDYRDRGGFPPGTVKKSGSSVFVKAADGWLRLADIEIGHNRVKGEAISQHITEVVLK